MIPTPPRSRATRTQYKTFEVLDAVAPTRQTEWRGTRSPRNYRNHEDAGMFTVYVDGEPMLPEIGAVDMEHYPRAWDVDAIPQSQYPHPLVAAPAGITLKMSEVAPLATPRKKGTR